MHPAFSAPMLVEEKLIKYEDRIGLNPAQRSALLTRLANLTDPDRRLDGGTADENGQVQGRPGSPLGILNTPSARPN